MLPNLCLCYSNIYAGRAHRCAPLQLFVLRRFAFWGSKKSFNSPLVATAKVPCFFYLIPFSPSLSHSKLIFNSVAVLLL